MRQPLCRFCGKKIAKSTESRYLRSPLNKHRSIVRDAIEVPVLPKTMKEAQALFNERVVAVSRCRLLEADDEVRDVGIDHVRIWDGQSYVDSFFCNGDHARKFAYHLARAGHSTRAYIDAEELRRWKSLA